MSTRQIVNGPWADRKTIAKLVRGVTMEQVAVDANKRALELFDLIAGPGTLRQAQLRLIAVWDPQAHHRLERMLAVERNGSFLDGTARDFMRANGIRLAEAEAGDSLEATLDLIRSERG